MLRSLGRWLKRTFRAGHEDHRDRRSVGGKTRRKVQVFVNGHVPLLESDLRIMRKKRSYRTKGVEIVFDGSLTESSDIMLNIEIPDFMMNDDEDPQSDDNTPCTNPSETSCPGTSATVSPNSIPLSQPLPPTTSRIPSSQPCPPLPTSLSVNPGPSSCNGDMSTADRICHAGFRTRPFRKPEGPNSAPTGDTRWYYTTAPSRLAAPSEMPDLLERGDLFLHEDTRNDQFQAWIWVGAAWKSAEDGIPHPIHGGKRRLWFRFSKEEHRYEPSWITKKSLMKYKKSQRQEMESGIPASPMFKGINARVRN